MKALSQTQTISCISLLLQNALEESLAVFPVAEHIKDFTTLIEYLENSQLETNFNTPLPNTESYAWSSQYNMLRWIENSWNEIESIIENQCQMELLEGINFENLKATNEFLKIFEEAINDLEQNNSPTLHLVIVYLHELKKSCNKDENDCDLVKTLKGELLLHLEKISKENITILHKLAIFLYPPTNKLLTFNAKEKQLIEKECIRLMQNIQTETGGYVKQEPELDIPLQPVSKRRKLFVDFVETQSINDPHELIIQELNSYKNIKVENTEDFDIFKWWELQRNNFPLLSKLSHSLFTTPASRASIHHIFTSAINLLYNVKSEAEEREVEQIMFLKINSDDYEMES